MRDLIESCPCLACGAWPGEPCRTLYSKDGSPGGKYTPGHHMVRCSLWHRMLAKNGKPNAGFGRLRHGTVAGCYYDLMHELQDGSGEVVHPNPREVQLRVNAKLASQRLYAALSRF